MLRTILFLIFTLLLLPFLAFSSDTALQPEHWQALRTIGGLMLGVAISCFIVSELTRNYSQVDKLWSILPIGYVWFFAAESGWNIRLLLMAGLVSLWGVRLTYNFARRGGYQWPVWKGEEDYRWAVLRQMPLLQGRVRWAAFNLFFISLYQNGLILLFTLPALAAWQGANSSLNLIDLLAGGLMLAFICIETIADQQQYNFQTEKYRRIREQIPLEADQARGFCSTGLWSRVRHPNYAAEQGIWLAFYLFSVAATGHWFNWSIIGIILLMLLFLGSSDFSEKISAGKYPEYAAYQKKVSRFIPGL